MSLIILFFNVVVEEMMSRGLTKTIKSPEDKKKEIVNDITLNKTIAFPQQSISIPLSLNTRTYDFIPFKSQSCCYPKYHNKQSY